MKLSSFIYILAVIGILSLIIFFARGVLFFAIRFWYITIPILLYFIFKGNKKQVKNNKEDNIEDADFEIIDEDEEK